MCLHKNQSKTKTKLLDFASESELTSRDLVRGASQSWHYDERLIIFIKRNAGNFKGGSGITAKLLMEFLSKYTVSFYL